MREQDGVRLDTTAGSLPVLWVDPELTESELPDLVDSWAWVHVQSLAGLDGAPAAIAAGTGEVVARLVCPRRLLPDSAWLACVVPAFDGGVARGRGLTIPDGTEWLQAWEHAGAAPPLPVYHHWRFTTGPAGDFEALCRRLKPDDSGLEFGLHAMDITDPGLLEPAGETVLLDYEGALQTTGVDPRPWGTGHQADFQTDLEPLLNDAVARADYDPAIREPLVGPPLYGQWPAGTTKVPGAGWQRTLNLHPVGRASAGLGARAVRATQEELVAGAWAQAGSLRATVTALNQGRLAVEVGRRLTARVATLSDGDVLHLTAPLQALLGSGFASVRSRLAASAVPAGLVSVAHLRLTRPGTPLARDWAAFSGSPEAHLSAEHVQTTLAATGDESEVAALAFASYGRLVGAQRSDPTLLDPIVPSLPDGFRARTPDPDPIPDPEPLPFPIPVGGEDVSDIAADAIRALDPVAAVRASVLARVPALDGLLPADALPTSVAVAPSFDAALYEDLVGLGAGYLLPGAGELPRNRVRLVETNTTFVGAFLIGANHELARELLWRGYPVDLRATFLKRFWSYVDVNRPDIGDLSGWTEGASIVENIALEGEKPMTVMVVRGDLVRRYPTAHYFLQKAQLRPVDRELEPVPGQVEPAIFRGALDAETLFVGFELATEDVIGDRPGGGDPGWLFAIEEQPAAPRFGLDDPGEDAVYGVAPATWNDLSWANVARSEAKLAGLTHAPVVVPWRPNEAIEGTTWGHNAAHMARACWQRPFRMFIPADQLV